MKKFIIPAFVFFLFITTFGCKKNSPAAVATAIPTFNYSVLASVPSGSFTQTDGTNSFNLTISTFKMGKYLVTYDLWYTVYRWAIAIGYNFANAGAEGSDGTPGAAPTSAKYQP